MALFHYFDVVTNTRGDSLVGYQVAVRSNGTVVPIYADENGTPIATKSGIANVALTDDAGNFSIYVDLGTYDLEVRTPAGVFVKRISDVPMMGGPAGEAGSDAGRPISYRETATAGQTVIPGDEADFSTVIRTDGGTGFDYLPATVSLFVNGILRSRDTQYTAPGNFEKIALTSPLSSGDAIELFSYVSAGSGGTGVLGADEVDVSSYPGTSVTDDPNRLNHDNVRFKNAQLDVTNPNSPNFRKAVRFFPGGGSGQPILTDYDGNPVPQLTAANDPADPLMNARAGDWTIDSLSQNNDLPDDWDGDPSKLNTNYDDPGNWMSGVIIRAHGCRFRRPNRRNLYPFILCCDPVRSAATTDPETGIDTQSDVFVGNRLEGFPAFIGENHWRGYLQHANEIQVNGVTDFYCEAVGYGQRSDLLYIGAGSVGGGLFNRHNKRVEYHCIADGYNQNNRNVVSVVDVDGEIGHVWARRFSKFGGPAPLDNMDPNTGVGAPGVHDSEPNASFTDDPIYRNSEVWIYAEDCSSAGALFLPYNGSFPNPCRNIKRHVRHVRTQHGFIGQYADNPAVPYGIEVDISCDQSERAFEMLNGGGKWHVDAVDCPKANYIGYFQATAGDFHLSGDFTRCGGAAGVVNENRGWAGGSAKGVRFIECTNSMGFRHIPGGVTRDLVFDGVEFGPGMAYGHYVDNATDLRGGSIRERGVIQNANNNYRWSVVGAHVKSIPGAGLWTMGDEVLFNANLEPGSPRLAQVTQTNTTGAPYFFVQAQRQPVPPDPTPSFSNAGFPLPLDGVLNQPSGRLTALKPNARAFDPNMALQSSWVWRGRTPYSGNQLIYIGVTASNNPTGPNDITYGIWFGDQSTGGPAVGVVNGSPAGSKPFAYGMQFYFHYGSNGTVDMTISNADGSNTQTLFSSPAGVAFLRPVILFGASGESIMITSAGTQ